MSVGCNRGSGTYGRALPQSRFIFGQMPLLRFLTLILLFCCYCHALLSQTGIPESSFPILPELTELSAETAEITKWGYRISPILTYSNAAYDYSVDTRNYLTPATRQLISRQDFKMSNDVSRLTASYYEKYAAGSPTKHTGAFQLSHYGNPQLRLMILGMYNVHLGEGLAYGSNADNVTYLSNQPFPRAAHDISLPVLPYKPYLLGTAVRVRMRDYGWLSWLSAAPRRATISDGKISALTETAYWSDRSSGNVTQNVQGTAFTYYSKHLEAGTYISAQQFSRSFADTTLAQKSGAIGIFGSATGHPLGLDFEINSTARALFASNSLINQQLARAIRFTYSQKQLNQNLRYLYRPDTGIVGFARPVQVFGNQSGREEISWDVVYHPLDKLFLTGRFAAFRELQADSDLRWKDRQILSLRWKCDQREVTVNYYRYRRSAVPVNDSLYSDLLPTQHRYRIKWSQKILPGLKYHITCQYQQYTAAQADRNGFNMIHSLTASGSKLHAELAVQSWSNQKSIYTVSDPQSDDEYLCTTDRGSALRMALNAIIRNNLTIDLSASRPLEHPSRQTLRLNIALQAH